MQNHILCEVVQDIPRGAKRCRWTFRADNDGHYHRIVSLSKSPLYLKLHWRRTKTDAVKPVGVFRLDLDGLLREGYIRHEPKGSHGSEVRVRIVRHDDGSFYVQTNRDGPRFYCPAMPPNHALQRTKLGPLGVTKELS
jgi:hypothetical protein